MSEAQKYQLLRREIKKLIRTNDRHYAICCQQLGFHAGASVSEVKEHVHSKSKTPFVWFKSVLDNMFRARSNICMLSRLLDRTK